MAPNDLYKSAFDSLSSSNKRLLYKQEYVKTYNCNISEVSQILFPSEGEDFDPALTNVDDTIGTWLTSYIILFIGVVGAIYFLFCRGKKNKVGSDQEQQTVRDEYGEEPKDRDIISDAFKTHKRKKIDNSSFWIALYYFLTAISYGFSGVRHQFYRTEDKQILLMDFLSYLFLSLSFVALQVHVVLNYKKKIRATDEEFLTIDDRKNKRKKKKKKLYLLTGVVLLWTLAFGWLFLTQYVFDQRYESWAFMGMSAYMVLVNLILGVWYFGLYSKDWWVFAGCLFYMSGLVSQVILTDACGNNAYLDGSCFSNCLLPTDPLVFNHNALYHSLVILALILQAAGRYSHASTSSVPFNLVDKIDNFSLRHLSTKV